MPRFFVNSELLRFNEQVIDPDAQAKRRAEAGARPSSRWGRAGHLLHPWPDRKGVTEYPAALLGLGKYRVAAVAQAEALPDDSVHTPGPV